MTRLIECVPNFSEGRDEALVQALADAVAAVPAVLLLDRARDADHHRSVLTFAGPADAVGEAAFRAVQLAGRHIDLRLHQGGHPCVGATDVVPFVPLEGSTMGECVELARLVGERIGRELQIPVFFYEEAATHADRRRLETIRRGGLPGLAQRMASRPDWRPDCGPSEPHPTAGVTVVGARPFLVAFNVNLASRDLSVANSIAKAVRASNGGLAAVKAIGVDLPSRGMVQVSMNLVDLDVTPVHVAFEAVRAQAERVGVPIAESEVIGLVPQRAVTDAAADKLRLTSLASDQILELRLARARRTSPRLADKTLAEVMAEVGSSRPTPAGAAVAAVAGALAAQLGAKLVRLLASAEAGDEEAAGLERLDRCHHELCRLTEQDAVAYETVLQAQRRPRDDPGRRRSLEAALNQATLVPLEMADRVLEILAVLNQVSVPPGRATRADLDVARLLAANCLRALITIVDSNVKRQTNHGLKDILQQRRNKIESYLEGLKGLC